MLIGMETQEQGLVHKLFGFVCIIAAISNDCSCRCCFILLDGVESKMGLIHEDNVDWFLTLTETHHKFLTVGAKGGAAAGGYINPSFPCSGEQCIASNFHTMGVYDITLRGKPLPPLYILSMALLQKDDYRVDPCICKGLPTVAASYRSEACRYTRHQSACGTRVLWTRACGINLFGIFTCICMRGAYPLNPFAIL